MDYATFWVIFTVFFWVLVALAVVCLIMLTYIHITYYKWNREEREQDLIIDRVANAVSEKLENPDTM